MVVMKLRDCCTIIAGQSPESKYYNTDGIGTPFFQGKADFGELYPAVRVYCSQPTKIAEKDDVLLSVRAPVGATNLAPGRVCIGRGLTAIRPCSNLKLKYLLYFFRYFQAQLQTEGTGTTFKAITQSIVMNIELPVPPLVEQKRIVAKIEELFSELDNGVETLKMIKSKVDRYKYSVIDSVLPSENKKSIADCIKEMGQGWSPKCERVNVVDDDNWAVIKTTAVQPCKFLFNENKALPSSLAPRERHEIMAGDILITRAGPKSRCGVCCMVRKTKRRLLNCDKVYRLRLHEDIVLPQYLEYVLNSPAFIQEINLCKTGGNDSGLNLTQDRFLSIRIPVPSIKKQEEIVSEIESRRSVCDSIEKTVNAALQQSEAMRQSILKKAFEGEL